MDGHEVIQVGDKYDSWALVKKTIQEFKKRTFTEFYVRDSRTLKQSEKTTPKVVEKANQQLKYTFVKYSCIQIIQESPNKWYQAAKYVTLLIFTTRRVKIQAIG